MNRSLRILRPHVGGQRSVLAVAGLSTVLLAVAEIARPFPLKIVIDHLVAESAAPGAFRIDGEDLLTLAGVAALVLTIAGVEALAAYQMEMRLRRAGESIAHSLRVAVYAHLQRLSLAFHDRRQQGDLVTRATGDVHAVGQLFSESVGALASSALLLMGMLVVSLLLDPLLALAAFSVAPMLAVLTFLTRRRVKAVARHQRTMEGEIASLATETLSAMRAVKALGSERFDRDRLERVSEERQAAGIEAARIEGRFAGAVDILGSISAAVVLVVGVFRVASGAISPGDLVVMASYARRVHRPLRELARETGRVARGLARADRVAEILASDEVLTEPAGAYHGPRARGDLELEGVTFSYGAERPALADVSFRIAAGERVVVSGPSGAGKSTVAALIARFYDPDAGRVLIDGHDLKQCALSWVRPQVGLVLQDTILFTGTASENIAYGTRAGPDEVRRAAKAASAHGFIAELPNGYDTMLGPRGMALSGGQRQRIAIARTLLRDPPLLVLDEPTAALDERAEADVLTSLEALFEGRTTVIITHSPALARWADRVVAIDRGRLVRPDHAAQPLTDGPAAVPMARPIRLRPADAPQTVPADAALPGMHTLLDPSAMADVFARALDDGRPTPRVRVSYLRYKPETNLVVRYEVSLEGKPHDATAMIASGDYLGRRALKPENLALAAMVDGRAPAARALAYDPEVGCLIQWYPLDLALPALAVPPERLCHRLWSEGIWIAMSDEEPRLLAYKPRRRAVLCIGEQVVKCYAAEADFMAASRALQAAGTLHALRVPRFDGTVPAIRLTAQSLIVARPVTDAAEMAGTAGALLSALHGTDRRRTRLDALPLAPPARQLQAAAASARLVIAIAPALRVRVERLLGDLEGSAPRDSELVPSHGDFNARQLLVANGGLALTDFDEFCLAPRALDLATYVAYTVRGDFDVTPRVEDVLGRLLDGYGERPPAMGWYLATMMLRRAPRPFRYFEPGWPDRVEAMVRAAEAAHDL